MKRHLITKGCLIVLSLILFQCTQKKGSSVGVEYYQRENRGSEDFDVFYAAASDTFFHTSVNNGSSSYLYFGHTTKIQSKILLQFGVLPDTGTVDSARVILWPRNIIGPSEGSLTASIHTITKEWDGSEITWETFDDSHIGDEISTKDISAESMSDTFFVTFTLSTPTVQSWIDNSEPTPNHGMLLSSSEAPFHIEFYSGESSIDPERRPILIIYMTIDTLKQFAALSPAVDTFIATTQQEPAQDRLFVANGTALRSYIEFDIDSIPSESTINGAFLTMYVDTSFSFPDDNGFFGLQTHPVTESNWIVPTIPYNSLAYVVSALGGDSAVINITPFVQSWNAGGEVNYGLLIVGEQENTSIYQRAFYSTKADSAKRPKLKIFYSLSPSSRI